MEDPAIMAAYFETVKGMEAYEQHLADKEMDKIRTKSKGKGKR